MHSGKEQLLQARLSKRLRSTGISSVDEYLKVFEKNYQELNDFIDAISTNHTFFFRESSHLACLRKEHEKIWCAACSSGEEPFSISIYCLENGFCPSIFATDISTSVLRMGERGVFPIEKAKNVSPPILKKYFKKGYGNWEGSIKVKENIKRMVTFNKYNLVTDPLPSKKFDTIFCRNVLIYFDNNVKTVVVNKLYDALEWNGIFIIGGAESLNNIQHRYKYIKPSIYQKVSNY